MNTEWDSARQAARNLISRYHISDPPVNVFEIAKNEGIEIVFFRPTPKTEGVSGVLEKTKKRIYLNALESPKRQAYTLAHELGHYFLKHRTNEYGVYRRDTTYEVKLPKEKEADMFAAELLMPRRMLLHIKNMYGLTDNDANILANMFAVSESAMRYRLKSLKSKYDANEEENDQLSDD